MNRPFIGWQPTEESVVYQGDVAEPGETTVLCVPLTRECRDGLYNALVIAFSGIPERHKLAGLALATIGIEPRTKTRDGLESAA